MHVYHSSHTYLREVDLEETSVECVHKELHVYGRGQ